MTDQRTAEQQAAPEFFRDYPVNVVAICTAYEAGFSDGTGATHKANPYDSWTDEWFAWSFGVRCGVHRKLAP